MRCTYYYIIYTYNPTYILYSVYFRCVRCMCRKTKSCLLFLISRARTLNICFEGRPRAKKSPIMRSCLYVCMCYCIGVCVYKGVHNSAGGLAAQLKALRCSGGVAGCTTKWLCNQLCGVFVCICERIRVSSSGLMWLMVILYIKIMWYTNFLFSANPVGASSQLLCRILRA